LNEEIQRNLASRRREENGKWKMENGCLLEQELEFGEGALWGKAEFRGEMRGNIGDEH
jgi:hypothetical protein